MNLIQVQLDAIRRDQLQIFRSRRPIWSKKRRRTSTTDAFTNFDRREREDDRELYPDDFFDSNRYDERERGVPPEYPFQDFNYGP